MNSLNKKILVLLSIFLVIFIFISFFYIVFVKNQPNTTMDSPSSQNNNTISTTSKTTKIEIQSIKSISSSKDNKMDSKVNLLELQEKEPLDIPLIRIDSDINNNGINDMDDFIIGARQDVKNKSNYRSDYYQGGYPPEDEGVCTDTIWRAFMYSGYILKDMVDTDIKNNIALYSRINGSPDPNIDFRRVQNLVSYFDQYAEILTIEIIPNDIDNLTEWQGGDIVVFDHPYEHIAIVSDKRNDEGIPYIIHNPAPYPKEEDVLIYWRERLSPIIRHYRFPKKN